MYTYISKGMRFTKNKSEIKPTVLHYIACMLAIGLVCFSLLCIYSYTTSAYASTGFLPTNGNTTSGQVTPDDTETETPPPTTTNTPTITSTPTTTSTPSPTVTTTSTPGPLPRATSAITSYPTSTSLATPAATVQYSRAVSSTQTSSPGATPASTATTISVSTQGTGTNQTPVTSPATTNNMSDQSSQGTQNGNNFIFSVLKLGLGSLALLGLLFIAGWNIMRRRLLSMSSSKFPPSGAAPWSRTRIDDQVSPVSSLIDDETLVATSLALHANQPVVTSHLPISSDTSYLAARIRERRNELRAIGSLPGFQKPGESSADITELSDAYLESLVQLYRERKNM